MDNKPGISIIIPCYNCSTTIERCVKSIGDNENLEVIFIEDCSTDDTAKKLQLVAGRYFQKTKYIINENEKNIGAGKSRNRGIELASKEYLIFLDSDDEFEANFYERIISILSRKKYDCVCFDAVHKFKNKNRYLKMFFTSSITEGEISTYDALVYIRGCTWGKVYKTSIISHNNLTFSDIPIDEDLVFTKSAVSYCENIYYLECVLYIYNDNESSLMHRYQALGGDIEEKAFNQIHSRIDKNRFYDELNSVYFLEVLYSVTLASARTGKTASECREIFDKLQNKYNKKDKYYKKYNFKYKFAYFTFRNNMFFIYKLF